MFFRLRSSAVRTRGADLHIVPGAGYDLKAAFFVKPVGVSRDQQPLVDIGKVRVREDKSDHSAAYSPVPEVRFNIEIS